uniref:Putative isopenicillin-n-synthase n=1 Tax=Beroe abyssicola TaxID=320166 RepID=A0A0A0RW27_BERAB|nr:putative isopenicillin-n-synthase [Beroe abyssicola]
MVTKLRNPLDNVPKLDYSQIMGGEMQAEILSALREFAFFYIVDIPGFEAETEMEVMREFFRLPLSAKERYGTVKHNPNNTNVLRGYGNTKNALGLPIEEVYNIGQFGSRDIGVSDVSCRAEFISREANMWPRDGDFPGSQRFRCVLANSFKTRIDLARNIVDSISAELDYPEFSSKFQKAEFTSLYLKKYSTRDGKDNVHIYKADSGYSMKTEGGLDLSVPAHVDTTVTLLATYRNGGLQAVYRGAWYDVPSVMGSLMMMSGNLIEDLTDGKLPALQHRVLDIKEERYSTPFFFNPSFEADISRTQSGKETGKGFSQFGPWQVIQLHRDEPLLLNNNSLN